MVKKYCFFGFFLAVLFFYSSCFNSGDNSNIKPKAISKSNDIVVIADKNIWQSEPGDTFRYYFESAYPVTPNPEPLFKLRYFTFDQIDAESLRRQLRTYIVLVNLSDKSSKTTKMLLKDLGKERKKSMLQSDSFDIIYGHDKWARDQLIIYIAAKGRDNLIKAIAQKFNEISEKVHAHDVPQIKLATYFSGHNTEVESNITKLLGVKVKIPKDYKLALSNEDNKIVWARRDSKKAISNFVVQKLEYTDTSQFSIENAIKTINKFGVFVTTDTEGSKLVVNNKDLPVLKFVRNINDNYAVEYRGIWEMTKDFMGGAFVAYLVKNKNNNDLIMELGFVYGPGTDKKEYLQQLMIIANTLEFIKK
jgi:hypothetical protein